MASSETSATYAATQNRKKKYSAISSWKGTVVRARGALDEQKWDDKNGKYCILAHTNYFLRFNQIRQEWASGKRDRRYEGYKGRKKDAPANKCKCLTDKYKCIYIYRFISPYNTYRYNTYIQQSYAQPSTQFVVHCSLLAARWMGKRKLSEAHKKKQNSGQTTLENSSVRWVRDRCRRGP